MVAVGAAMEAEQEPGEAEVEVETTTVQAAEAGAGVEDGAGVADARALAVDPKGATAAARWTRRTLAKEAEAEMEMDGATEGG